MTALLAGRCVAVTGAGTGLGRAYAVACAAHGADVVVNDLDETALDDTSRAIVAVGGAAEPVVGSVASWDVAAAMVTAATRRFGRLDGLVANAGVTHHAAPWEETEQSLRRIVEVNVLGVQFCATHAMAAMVRQGTGGAIVTVVSSARSGIAGMSAYGATKGAVAAMTAGWALEGKAVGIRVNALSPLAQTSMAALDQRPDRPRLGSPADVAPAVVALLSDATAGVTGQIIRFDGVSLGWYESERLHTIDVAAGTDAAELARALTRLG